MNKRLSILLLLLSSLWATAQDRQLTGVITSSEDGQPLPGVSISIKGTAKGATTNADGAYQLAVSSGNTLVFSYVGFTSKEVVLGDESTLNIQLQMNASSLSEVVVTALGITREKKALGYSVQEIGGKQLTQARETNLVNALSGKIAGVQVTNSNGSPGASSRMLIRGSSSIGNNNQPLFVVDGVPIDNGNYNNNPTAVDYGNGAASLNPDDIESMSVLKGPAAAALYGSRGANGVVLITLKSGKGSRGIGVSVNSNTTFDTPFRLPEWQNEYGQGAKGQFRFVDGRGGGVNDGVDESWGPRLDGRLIEQFDSPVVNGVRTPTPWVAHPDNVNQFFKTGKTYTNNISLTGGIDKGDFRLSLTDLNQSGILPFTNYKRQTVSLNAGWNLTPKLNIRATGNYVKDGSDNRTNWGLYFIWFGRQVDMENLQNYTAPGSIYQNNWNYNYWTNPYYQLANSKRENEKDRLFGNISATYKFTDWLSLMARTGTDFYTDRRKTKNAARTSNLFDGYNEEQIFVQESNSDFLLNATHKFGEFDVTANVGGNHRKNFYQRDYMSAAELAIPRVWNMGNSRLRPVTENSYSKKVVNSLYASANLGFRNYLFLDLTARNDWSSALPASNRSYFYPSAAVSAVLTDMFSVQSSFLSFAKIRGGIARVGNDTDPYRLLQAFDYANAWGSQASLKESNELLNAELKPEITSSYEIGTELKFWQNRIGLDVTYYDKQSYNQILKVDVSNASGFSSKWLNAGLLQNRGVEIQLTGTAVKTNSFKWDITLNWARNQNKVKELVDNLTTYTLGTMRGMGIEARVGQPYGTFFGQGFLRNPEGKIVYDQSGYPVIDPVRRVLGNFTPRWIGGLQNTFAYKNLSLTTLIDMKQGGDIFSQTINIGRYTGVLKETTVGRETGIVGDGVVNVGTAANPEYVPNTKNISSEEWHHKYYLLTNNEETIFDGSYVKLREVRLTYVFPGKVFKRLPFRDITISAVGRNLALLHSNIPHIDPETSYYGDTNVQGIENGQIPTTRSVGFNISLNL
ncbi:SusC/RagA family TonB-linked outer membrane protein [Siphonobacter sp. BAB-5405]|uniref:SusC/RagA family TonB-linked outer membrane protein n=1 Tax=Siphonobacter sp. BAB-5405 TaxID=1864825 RepID=UPI000C805A90|nr:SusC/RagA family TonB-linked outer membrane protein [Siphonobacter sp. BAB-5405]PMD98105.1 SusC/RagA family TonB-linked outer membrane protein [Siphonobacter sp. BAB-5405]